MNATLLSFMLSLMVPLSGVGAQERPAAVPGGAGAQFAAIDVLLNQIRPMVAQLEAFISSAMPAMAEARLAGSEDFSSLVLRAQKRLERKCADSSVDVMASDKDFPLDENSLWDLQRYYMCEAFSQRKLDLCKRLIRYGPRPEDQGDEGTGAVLSADCHEGYVNYIITQLNITSQPDAAKVCNALSVAFSADFIGDLSKQEKCAFLTGKPAAGCKKLMTTGPSAAASKEDVEDCFEQSILNGDGNVCRSLAENNPVRYLSRERCLETAAYRKAYQAKDVGLCGNSLGCRMLMGEKVCGGYLARVRKDFCRAWTQKNLKDAVAILDAEQQTFRKRSGEIMEAMKQRRAQVGALFIQLGNLMEDFEPKSDPGYESRRDAYKALRKKFEQPLDKRKPSREAPARGGRQSPGR